MTYDEFVRKAQNSGIPLADIRVVLDGYFKMPFDYLGIHGDEEAKDAEIVLQKLNDGYPANYLAGYIDILSLHLLLNESTLIPRNETADFIYNYLYNLDLNNKKILDLCTGSGFIAIALKKHFKDAKITASDISNDALSIAKQNAVLNDTDINFVKSDFLNDINDVYDIIVCNPPYIEENSLDVSAPYEPHIALFSGKDGLDSYRSIFKDLPKHLKGDAYFELESTNSIKAKDLFVQINPNGYKTEIWKDSYQRDRYLLIKTQSE